MPEAASGAAINYLVGSDASRWHRNLPAFGTARYAHVWPGVDLVFRGSGGGVHVEYHLGPGALPSSVLLHSDAAPEISAAGGLLLRGATGEITLPAPEVFLDSGASSLPLAAEYLIRGDNTVGLNIHPPAANALGGIASSLGAPLAAGSKNPGLVFSGYFGGTTQDNITAVAISTTFNVVVAGWTASTDLPASAGARHASGGGVDAFVANFSPVGGQLVYCTYLGGSGDDRAFGIAVDQSQNTYVTGYTSSSNFPVVGGVQSRLSGARDAFVTKLNSTGTAIVYSTYLGGSGVDTAAAIAIDSTGAAVIIGDTTSTNLPSTAGAYQRHLAGGQDVFLAKLAPAGNSIVFLTWLGGSAADHGAAVRIDANGNIVAGGGTFSTDFPVTPGLQTTSGGGQDGFVSKFSADGKSLTWSTYLGGSGGSAGAPELVTAVTVGAGGNITVGGVTSSLNFPVRGNAAQPVFGGGQTDGFLGRMAGTHGTLALSTYVGGSLDDGINAVANDSRGELYCAGYTSSTDFPNFRALQSSPSGGMDAFLIKADQSLKILYATYLGGTAADSANAIAVDAMSSIVIVGSAGSPDFPVSGNLSRTKPGLISGFIAKVGPAWSTAITSAPTVFYDPWHINSYNGNTPVIVQGSFGQAGDILLTGDWDGTGAKRIGLFRNGLWILDTNGNGVVDAGDRTVTFGQAGDLPIAGYFDGTGRPQLGLFRNGTFILDLSGHLTGVATGYADAQFPFGLAGDVPVAGDWNGSGTTKVGVFRNGTWLLDYDGNRIFNSSDKTYTFGQAGDIPVTGDWDSSGTATRIGIYRAGFWILDYAGDGAILSPGVRQLAFAFGGPAYKPLVF